LQRSPLLEPTEVALFTIIFSNRKTAFAIYSRHFVVHYFSRHFVVHYFSPSSTGQCFFKVFKRVSWWSFRGSMPFSLLCLILFHKIASFRPYMLTLLNTTFSFGKQAKVSFINRKVLCRPTHSFIYSFSCPLFLSGESRG